MTTIEEMQMSICAHNNPLADRVQSMTVMDLLNNAHPLDRDNYAKRLHREGVLTDEDYKAYQASTRLET